jgi:restriction system protein
MVQIRVLAPLDPHTHTKTENKAIMAENSKIVQLGSKDRLLLPPERNVKLPLLKVLDENGGQLPIHEAIIKVTEKYFPELTDEAKTSRLDSGQLRWQNRVEWARFKLIQSGEMDGSVHGVWRITPKGRARLQAEWSSWKPEYPEFHAEKTEEEVSREGVESRTPQEMIESNHKQLREALAQDLLEKVKGCPPQFFEELVVNLLVAMGYGGSRKDAGEAIGRSREIGGIDGVIKQDKLGLDVVYIQAKRWEDSVGLPIVSQFSGSLERAKATKGVLITTSRFTDDAKEFVKGIGKRIVLIDGEKLANLMIDHGVGVTLEASYAIKRVDPDYFGDAT